MSRVEVTEKQLADAATVWMQRLPKKFVDDVIRELILERYKQHSGMPQIGKIIAEHFARCFTQVGWTASYEDKGNIFADRVGRG